MLFRTIRSQLLGLVVATVVPLVAVLCFGLWNQLRDDQRRAMDRARDANCIIFYKVKRVEGAIL